MSRSKKAMVRELQIVLQDLKGHFAESRKRLTSTDLNNRFRHTIGLNGCVYLQGNQLSWEAFFHDRFKDIETLLIRRPGGLFDEWASWATTHEIEALRQKISLQEG